MNNQVAIVTGAAGGFGSAIVSSLLDVGYCVAATDVNAASLDRLSQSLGNPEKLKAYVMDVTDRNSITEVANDLCSDPSNQITVLVNNAGILEKNYCLREEDAVVSQRVIDINLTGSFNCTHVFSKPMAKNRYGRIINIASVAGLWGSSGGSAYAASKAGLIKAAESWARELGPMNISVTTLAPGICKTNMLNQFIEESRQAEEETALESKIVKSIVPIGRWGTAEDVSEVVTFLATCKTNYLSSAVISIDGGMRVGTL